MDANASFETIYDEYKNLVYNLALGYVQNTSDAEDITQEAFVKVYQNLHTYKPALASLKTWIYRIAINQSLDFIKSKKAAKRFGFLSGLFRTDAHDPVEVAIAYDHPGIAAEDKDQLHHLFRHINELPPNQKTALILTKIEGRPQKEVADIMEMDIKAVESLLQRAKQSLSKKIKP